MTVIGWDIGGANLKLARLEGERIAEVAQIPCPIKQDRGKFDDALGHALSLVPRASLHAVTMTGELSDVFADRADGVAYLVALMQTATAGQDLRIYAGRAGFLSPEDAVRRVQDVASANWYATAELIASRVGEALLIDIGTTTIDLIPVAANKVASRGYSDGERLTKGELIYAGVVRTPVMAIARGAPFKGRMQGIAAERFATMADVYRITGDLPEDADPYPTPDQHGKTREESAVRLARMLGRDAADATPGEWAAVGQHFAACQFRQIEAAATTLIAREALSGDAPIVGAGCGRFVAKRLAEQSGRAYLDFADLVGVNEATRDMAASCAPAVAVAVLARVQRTETHS